MGRMELHFVSFLFELWKKARIISEKDDIKLVAVIMLRNGSVFLDSLSLENWKRFTYNNYETYRNKR